MEFKKSRNSKALIMLSSLKVSVMPLYILLLPLM